MDLTGTQRTKRIKQHLCKLEEIRYDLALRAYVSYGSSTSPRALCTPFRIPTCAAGAYIALEASGEIQVEEYHFLQQFKYTGAAVVFINGC